MERDAVETGLAVADHRDQDREPPRTGRQEIIVAGVGDDVGLGRPGQGEADGFGVVRVWQDLVVGGAPELNRSLHGAQARASETTALILVSCVHAIAPLVGGG